MMVGKPGLEYGNYSGVGRVRERNEDYFGSFVLAKGHLFVVCDGMGGHKGGQMASQLAVETIRQYVETTVELEPTVFLRRAVEKANEAVLNEASKNPDLKGMGTTCVIMLVRPGSKPEGWVAHVGDSRMYRFRGGRIDRMTRDHSKVQKMVDMGILSQKEAEEHPQKNVITKAIGIEPSIYPDVKQIDLCKGDRYLLCTDGVTDLVTDADLELFAGREKEPQRLAECLVALSNERGGHDNATIQVIDIRKGPRPPRESRSIGSRRSVIVVLLLLIAIMAYVAFCTGETDDSPAETEEVQSDTSTLPAEEEEIAEPRLNEHFIQLNNGAEEAEPVGLSPSPTEAEGMIQGTYSSEGSGSISPIVILSQEFSSGEESGQPDTL